MTDHSYWQGGTEGDLRFQFEVIKNLADSVRQQSEVMRGVQQTQVSMLERLAKIEANRVNETVAGLDQKLANACERINKLESEEDIRTGGSRAWKTFLLWWAPIVTVVGTLFTVLFLLARASGVLHLPESKAPVALPAREEARPRAMSDERKE